MGQIGACCDPGTSGAGARCGSVWQLLVQEVCGISLVQPAGVHSINNCVLLG